jgi:hypothetical protein
MDFQPSYEGAASGEELSRHRSRTSCGSLYLVDRRCVFRGLRRFSVSEWHLSLRRRGARSFLRFWCVVLALYGLTVNIPHWDFGKLLGVYVVLFFLVAQLLAKIRFNQAPTTPIYVGGSMIVAGGIVIAFWQG